MRLWSLHPCYLDRQGLLAVWREALLAQKVLAGETVGYRRHPQLDRFRQADDPRGAIAGYLEGIRGEGAQRGFRFDPGKITAPPTFQKLPVSGDQLRYEWDHLKNKLRKRDPGRLKELSGKVFPKAHPLFVVVEGPIEPWERSIKEGEMHMDEIQQGETSRSDIRRLLKIFGVKADEMIITHLLRNPQAGPLKLRITMEDLTDYGDHPPDKPLHHVVEGTVRRD